MICVHFIKKDAFEIFVKLLTQHCLTKNKFVLQKHKALTNLKLPFKIVKLNIPTSCFKFNFQEFGPF